MPPPSPSPHWQDPFRLEDQLTDTERHIRTAAARFAAAKLAPRATADFRTAAAAPELLPQMGAAGLLGITAPQTAGGSDAGYVAYGLAAREIERIDSGYRSLMSVQSSLVIHPIRAYGSAAQQHRYLPPLTAGDLIGCFGLTEADAGTDIAAMRTTAHPTADGYRLNGAKMWITNSPMAHLHLVWAKSQAHDNRVRGFLIPRDTPGLSAPAIAGKWSMRASITGEILLDNCRVPRTALLPKADGLSAAFSCLNRARYGIAWGVIGAAESCWHAARDYGLHRRAFGAPLAQTQLYQQKLADMQTEITIAAQAALQTGRLMDADQAPPELISLIKRNNCHKALKIARAARDMHGANGITDAYPIIRHLLNLETVNTYEGTHSAHTLILGRAQTGLSAF